ncbi:LytR/AlgR family response regulator transcription factor [Mucilaginibacter rubeus]|uniref:Response regulator transcription factor n=1 Tax=Mucilaginibacter rubeus TaxID=2027860 RepID=A0A5C1I5A6_9SPHI|nr:LytTR family DNA-binding domain-containing protein [Mucilaginibacter rubeus]QEM12510.1 response regulator transcription factor [Mucilaginibacter rubeus]
MKLSCFILDDEDHAIEVLADYIEMTPDLKLIGSDNNPVLALSKIMKGEVKPDLLFLDIDMPNLSGIQFAQLVKGKTEVVFSTAFKEYAYQAFDINAIDFLLKPITYDRFLQMLDKVYAKKRTQTVGAESNFIFLQIGPSKKVIKVNCDEIIYVEGLSNYVRITMMSGKVHTIYTSMKTLLEKLPFNSFVQTHKSYIVNLKFVEIIGNNEIVIKGEHTLPIGESYKKNLLRTL